MPLFKKIQPVLIALLFMGCSGAVFAWMWYTVEGYGQELLESIQTIENQQAFENQYNELVSMVAETEIERRQLERYILNNEEDTIALLSRFDEIALSHNIDLATRELKVAEKKGEFNDLVLSFNLVGPEDLVLKMVEMFESLPYHGRVTSLSYSRKQDDATGEVEVNAVVSLILSIRKYDQ